MSRPEAVVSDSPRRKFFRIASRATIGLGGAVILGGLADATNNVLIQRRVTDAALKKYPRPPQQGVVAARTAVAGFEQESQRLAAEGALNQIPQITDPAAIKNAYGTLEQDSRFLKQANKQLEAMGLDKNRELLDLSLPLIGILAIVLGVTAAREEKSSSSPD